MNTAYVYSAFLVLSAFVSLLAIVVAWKRRTARGALPMMAFMGAVFAWSITYAFHWLANEPIWKYFWLNMTYFGVVAVPASYLYMALVYIGQLRGMASRLAWLLAIEPVIIVVLVWTDPLHGWFFAGQRSLTSSTIFDGSWVFWAHVIYSYTLLLLGSVILFRAVLHALGLYRWQLGLLISSILLPWIANILSVAGLTAWPNLDATPIVFSFAGSVILYDLIGWRLLDMVPVARDMLVDNLADGMLVLDESNRIKDFNPAACAITVPSSPLVVGATFEPARTICPATAARILAQSALEAEICVDAEAGLYLDVRICPLKDNQGRPMGRLFIWRDISQRKRAELELKTAHQLLAARFEEIESLQTQLREQAVRDGLTGLYNRRYLDEALEIELASARKTGTSLALVIMDIDFFKQVNDHYGHATGDKALQTLAGVLARYTRKSDIVCRYGGEEFAVVMPDIDEGHAISRADILRQQMASCRLVSDAGDIFSITLSAGLGIFPRHGQDAHQLMLSADGALYYSKQHGRNCVAIFHEQGYIVIKSARPVPG